MKKEETYCRLLPMAGAYNMRDLGGYRLRQVCKMENAFPLGRYE